MLQISQTEKPMCSATIDQMRLRRATALPLVFQYVSSSGFQSEIQVVLLIEDFLSASRFPAAAPKTKKPRPRRHAFGQRRCCVVLAWTQEPASSAAPDCDLFFKVCAKFVPRLNN